VVKKQKTVLTFLNRFDKLNEQYTFPEPVEGALQGTNLGRGITFAVFRIGPFQVIQFHR